jgi:succinyl-diaminopimelate desuccinylase
VTLAEALAARTEALCAVPSPIGEEKALCDEVERWARARFPAVRRISNSLVVRVDAGWPDAPPARAPRAAGEGGGPRAGGAAPGGPPPRVALCGHLDTVPVHAADRGRAPRREGGRLVAPGASDMKSGLAVAMELAERLPRAERVGELLLVLYAREEGPYLENELGAVLEEAPEVRAAGLAICLEPTDGHLMLGCVGSIHATVTFEGRAAHSARPWQGQNAVHKAGALLAELARRPPRDAESGGLVFHEVLSCTRIDGGLARNVVPDRCTLNLNFRFAPDKSPEAAGAELVALAERFGAAARLTDVSPACPAFAGDPLVERLRERTGARVEPKQAWTDVARLAAAGVPAVNFGPGATAQAHQQGEWVELAAVESAYRALERFLRP